MSQRISLKAYIAVIIAVLVIGIAAYCKLTEESSIVATALRWSNLAPLPKNATVLSAKREGGWTWRGYRVRFNANQQDIEEWLAKSPGIKTAEVALPSSKTQVTITGNAGRMIKLHNTTKYMIDETTVDNGYAEVNIDLSGRIVEVYTYNN